MNKFINPDYPLLSWSRVIGNALFIFGYAIILYGNIKYGILIRLLGNALSWPYFQKIRMYDILSIRAFFACFEIGKLIQIGFFS